MGKGSKNKIIFDSRHWNSWQLRAHSLRDNVKDKMKNLVWAKSGSPWVSRIFFWNVEYKWRGWNHIQQLNKEGLNSPGVWVGAGICWDLPDWHSPWNFGQGKVRMQSRNALGFIIQQVSAVRKVNQDVRGVYAEDSRWCLPRVICE